MASGNRLATWGALNAELPTTSPMRFDVRNDQPVLDGGAGVDEAAMFSSVLPAHYAGGGFQVKVSYSMSTATANEVRLDAQVERIGDEFQDTDSDSFDNAQSVTDTVPGTNGQAGVATIVMTNGEIDGLLVGEEFRLKITRVGTHGDDDATGDIEIKKVWIDET